MWGHLVPAGGTVSEGEAYLEDSVESEVNLSLIPVGAVCSLVHENASKRVTSSCHAFPTLINGLPEPKTKMNLSFLFLLGTWSQG